MDDNQRLERIRYYKGTLSDFKNFWDSKAGMNTNAYDSPEYQGFNEVHPVRGSNESPHWKDIDEPKN